MRISDWSSDVCSSDLLRHAAVDADHVAGGADLLDAAAVGEGAAAVGLPLVHLAEGPQHGEVHQAARLGGNGGVAPAEAPAPLGHRLLKGAAEVVGLDRKSAGSGKRGSVRVDLGGGRL